MSSAIDVRRATPDDAPAISSLALEVQSMHAAAEPAFFRPAGPWTFPPEAVRALMARGGHMLWLATSRGAAVGYAHAEAAEESENPWKLRARVINLHAMGVRADFRGQGVGSRLIDEVRREALRRRVDRLVLSVWAFNDDARRFYARHGFVTYQERLWLVPTPRETRE